MKKVLKRNFSLLLILFLAAIFRLVGINQGLWLDEAIGAIEVKKHNFSGIINSFMPFDNHPPFYYLLLEAWTNIFGFSDFAIRSLSILLGLASVFFSYKIAKTLFSDKRWTPFAVALFMATSPFHVYYSQEARMYILASFFTMLAVYFFSINLKKNSLFAWFFFSLSITFLIFSDYLPILMLPVFWLMALRIRDKKWWIGFLFSHIPLIFLGILWFPVFIHQLSSGSWLLSTLPAWGKLAGGATLKNALLVWMKFVLGRISFEPKIFYYFLVFIASVFVGVLFGLSFRKIRKFLLIHLWFLVPLLLGFAISFIFPAFNYFRFLFIYPAFVFLLFCGLAQVDKNTKVLFFLAILSFNILGFLIYTLDKNQHREKWRETVAYLETQAQAKSALLFVYPEPFAPYRWYQKGVIDAFGVTDSISANKKQTIIKTRRVVANKEKLFYFSYLEDLTDPHGYVRSALKSEGFEITGVINEFTGVGNIYIWERKN